MGTRFFTIEYMVYSRPSLYFKPSVRYGGYVSPKSATMWSATKASLAKWVCMGLVIGQTWVMGFFTFFLKVT